MGIKIVTSEADLEPCQTLTVPQSIYSKPTTKVLEEGAKN